MGKTQQQIANSMGLSQKQISNITGLTVESFKLWKFLIGYHSHLMEQFQGLGVKRVPLQIELEMYAEKPIRLPFFTGHVFRG